MLHNTDVTKFVKTDRQKIAVIGSGISGSSSAWLLRDHHDVTLYEKNKIAGGHTATIDIDYDGTPISVDTGFIVYNELNYPHLTSLFDHLKVQTHDSDMSFAMSRDLGKFEWGGNSLAMLFAQKRNVFRLEFLNMLREVFRFNNLCVKDRDKGHLKGRSIGEYLIWRGFSPGFQNNYLMPMAAAIWSSSANQMLEFPALQFVNFFDNHRLIHRSRPSWRTVTGGSRNYLDKLHADLGDRVKLDCGVENVTRAHGKVKITDSKGHTEIFDQVIFACHTDQMINMIEGPTEAERDIATFIPYSMNKVYLHRDASLMPKRKAVWASWNYLCSSNETDASSVAVSYWMNQLQDIDPSKPLFVTLNPTTNPDPELTFGEYNYAHPQFGQKATIAQLMLEGIQGQNNTWFAGAWTGSGFHEDGLRSAVKIANMLGCVAPWQNLDKDVTSDNREIESA
jgi:predicted NAD/FAD-binding protein